jgi:MHS family shikimate/dehydroshikimate transporter-like MFS transporter
MQTIGEADARRDSPIRQVALASFIGTAIEWYDFYLYGTTAALVFPKLFFPQLGALSATLASFGTFGVAFVARPVGGIVFGHFGDRIGRKSMLVVTLLLMGIATFLIGLAPTFQQVGQLAPILLIGFRFLQGFALGGEWGGATLMVVEHAPERRRNFYAGWPQAGAPVGLILSTGVFAIFSSMPDEQFFAWGWRVPFLLSIVLVVVGLFIRLRVLESPVFARIRDLKDESGAPLIEMLRDYPKAFVLAIGPGMGVFVQFYLVTTFVPSYATAQLGVTRSVVLTGVMLFGLAFFTGVVAFAALADHIGKRPIALWSAIGILVLAYPFFWLVDTGTPVFIWLAMTVWSLAGGALYGVTGAFMAELFPARLRYSGLSFSAQMGGLFGGALTPIMAIALVSWSGGRTWPVATYASFYALLSFAAIYLASDKYRVSIQDPRPRGGRLSGGLLQELN